MNKSLIARRRFIQAGTVSVASAVLGRKVEGINPGQSSSSEKHILACYYFPNYHVDPRNEDQHGPGWSEWELVKCARPRFKGLNVKTNWRHDRRALSANDLGQLLRATTNAPERSGHTWRMSGPERALLYQLAMETGLRSSEPRSLTRASFDLDANPPTVTV